MLICISQMLFPCVQTWTFKCKDGMKHEADVSQDSFEVECREDDTFEPADYTTWPKCRACELIHYFAEATYKTL